MCSPCEIQPAATVWASDLQVLAQRQQQQAALQQQPLSLQQQEHLDAQQPLKHSSSQQHQQQLQLRLQQQQQPVLALDSNGSAAGSIHVSSRQQHVQGRSAGSGRLACLSLALPIADWR